MKLTLFIIFSLFLSTTNAKTIANVDIANIVSHSDQSTKLILNGAGIRTKFIFDIYIGSLYLEKIQKTSEAVYATHGEKRISMHFLYDEVNKEKLVDGWNDGFKNNLTTNELTKFKAQIEQFNSFFVTVKKGDVIHLNFIPTTGTEVIINNKSVGNIEGDIFFTALLKIWLGDDPADSDLKKAMLGAD